MMINAPKTSSEVELMETCINQFALRKLRTPKTSSEVELMETNSTIWKSWQSLHT